MADSVILETNKVSRSGDTMSGALTVVHDSSSPHIIIKNDTTSIGDTPATEQGNYLSFRDDNNDTYAWVRGVLTANGNVGAGLSVDRTVNGTPIFNDLHLWIDGNGAQSVTVANPASWRTALNAVNKSGDTISGTLIRKFGGDFPTSTPSTASTPPIVDSVDVNDNRIGGLEAYYGSNGERGVTLTTERTINANTTSWNYLHLSIKNDGTNAVYFSDAAAWKEGLGIGNKAQNFGVGQFAGTGQFFGLEGTVVNTNSTLNGKKVALIPTEYGILMYNITNSATLWSGNFVYEYINTASQIAAVPSSNAKCRINSAYYYRYGRVAMIDITVQTTAAVSSGDLILTVNSGKRPVGNALCFDSSGRYATFATDGRITTWSSIANGSTFGFRSTYIVAM